MTWTSPAVFLGEFDALEGPKISHCFEYFQFTTNKFSIAKKCISLLQGTCLLSKHVASGKMRDEYSDYMQSVAARALLSNESGKESIVFQDSQCPAVASISFCLPDILARGEKRRYCLIFVHAVYQELITRWGLIGKLAHMLIDGWIAVTDLRHRQEYAAFSDLEELREEARRKPLRSLMSLLSLHEHGDCGGDDGAWSSFRRTHAFFECALPLVFSTAYTNSCSSSLLHEKLEEEISFVENTIQQIEIGYDGCIEVTESPLRGSTEACRSHVAARPLVVWLIDLIKEDDGSDKHIELLLTALFGGSQILIHSYDGAEMASGLALSLTYTLPVSLRRTKLECDAYVMPYEGRIVTFNADFLSRQAAVSRSREPTTVPVWKYPLLQNDVLAEDVVCVTVHNGRISQVYECDHLQDADSTGDTPSSVSRGANNNNNSYNNNSGSITASPSFPQLVVSILRSYLSTREECDDDSASLGLRVLNAQFSQLVREYVLRGKIYRKLYQQQSVTALLRRGDAVASTCPVVSALPSSNPSQFAHCFSKILAQHKNNISNTTHYLPSRNTVNGGFNQNLFLCSVSPKDHSVLMFLGTASDT